MSALKLYLNNAAAPYDPTTERGTWNDVSALVTKLCSITKDASGDPASSGTQVGDGTANHTYIMMKFVEAAAAARRTFVAGQPWSGAIGIVESSSSMNAWLALHVWVTVGDSDTVRGTIINNYIDANEAATSATADGEGCSGTIYETFTQEIGDRICIEVGMKCNTTNTSYTATEHYGGSNATDLTDAANSQTYPAWLQFAYNAATINGGTADGYVKSTGTVYATVRAGAGLTSNNSDYAHPVGQQLTGSTYNIWQMLIPFLTSMIGAGNVPTVATIKDWGDTNASTTDFDVDVYVVPNVDNAVSTADWLAGADIAALTRVATWNSAGYSGGQNAFTSDAAFLSAINVSGTTWLLFVSRRQSAGTAPTGNEYVILGSAENTGYGPTLELEWALTQTIAPAALVAGGGFGAATVVPGAVTVVAQAKTASEGFGLATVSTAGAATQTIAPAALAASGGLGSPTVVPGAVAIASQAKTSGLAFGLATILPGAVAIAAAAITAGGGIGSPSVGPGAVTVAAVAVTAAESLGSPSVSVGAVNVGASALAASSALGQPLVSYVVCPPAIPPSLDDIEAIAIAASEGFGVATVTIGPATIAAAALAANEQFGAALVVQKIAPAAVVAGGGFGAATVVPGAVTVVAQAKTASEGFGSPTILPGAVAIAAAALAAGGGFGAPSVVPSQGVTAQALVASEGFGAATVTPGPATIAAAALAANEQFGAATITLPPQSIAPAALAASSALGTPAVSYIVRPPAIPPSEEGIEPVAITPGTAFGAARLIPGVVAVAPSAITANEQIGSPSVNTATLRAIALTYHAFDDDFGSAFDVCWTGSPTVVPGGITVATPNAIPAAESFGSPIVGTAQSVGAAALVSDEKFGSHDIFNTTTIRAQALTYHPFDESYDGCFDISWAGSPTVLAGEIGIVAAALEPDDGFGSHDIFFDTQSLLPAAIVSASAFGNTRVGAVVIRVPAESTVGAPLAQPVEGQLNVSSASSPYRSSLADPVKITVVLPGRKP